MFSSAFEVFESLHFARTVISQESQLGIVIAFHLVTILLLLSLWVIIIINYLLIIFLRCWSGDMNKRPDFAELRQVRIIDLLIHVGRTKSLWKVFVI